MLLLIQQERKKKKGPSFLPANEGNDWCLCNASAGARDSSAPLKRSVLPRQSGGGEGKDKEDSRGSGAGARPCRRRFVAREIKAAYMSVRLRLGEARPRSPSRSSGPGTRVPSLPHTPTPPHPCSCSQLLIPVFRCFPERSRAPFHSWARLIDAGNRCPSSLLGADQRDPQAWIPVLPPEPSYITKTINNSPEQSWLCS